MGLLDVPVDAMADILNLKKKQVVAHVNGIKADIDKNIQNGKDQYNLVANRYPVDIQKKTEPPPDTPIFPFERLKASHTEIIEPTKKSINIPATLTNIFNMVQLTDQQKIYLSRLAHMTKCEPFTTYDLKPMMASKWKISSDYAGKLIKKFHDNQITIMAEYPTGYFTYTWNPTYLIHSGEEYRITSPSQNKSALESQKLQSDDNAKMEFFKHLGQKKGLSEEIAEIYIEDGLSMLELRNKINEAKKKGNVYDEIEYSRIFTDRYQRLERRFVGLESISLKIIETYAKALGVESVVITEEEKEDKASESQ